jgi:hypothetical protein
VIRYTEEDGIWRARAEVVVGIEHRALSVDLGRLTSVPPPGGLLGTPVVTVAAGAAVLVTAGARRAGKAPTTLTLPATAEGLPGHLLVAAIEGAEVLVVEDGGAEALVAARILGGRPLPALPLDDRAAVGALLAELAVDVDLALPSEDRTAATAILAPYEPERQHHLVDVDPRPAFDELGWDPARGSLGDRAAAATGVLAGRVAAGNRRWRA